MYAIACIFVFAILIISSKQLPQENMPDEAPDGSKSEMQDNAIVDVTESLATSIGDDNVSIPFEAPDDLISESQDNEIVDVTKSPVSPFDDDDNAQDVSQAKKNANEYISNVKVNLPYFNTNSKEKIPSGETDDLNDYQIGYLPIDKSHDAIPQATDYLDRNKPEPGFDLTRAEIQKFKLWPDAQIPYFIDTFSFSDKVLRDKIRSFLSSVNSLTSLSFVELPSPPNDNSRWVFFINRRGLLGCADHSIKDFTNEGVQHVVLGYHCMSTEGELAEAVLAIAGVPPQHNAPDRDDYIQIKEENIMSEKKYLFQKLSDEDWLFHDLEYDFESAGHYNSHKYSVNGRATIEPQKKVSGIIIGESKVLTPYDIQKIRMLYNYIAKKRLLQATDCHKLFEPGKKFKDFKDTDNQMVPRPKPYQYTGIDPNIIVPNIVETAHDKDKHKPIIQDMSSSDESLQSHDNIKIVSVNNTDNNIDVPHNYEQSEISEEQSPEEYNYLNPGPNVPDEKKPQDIDEYENLSVSDDKEMAAKIISIARPEKMLKQMSGNSVILSVLSDYRTDKEYTDKLRKIRDHENNHQL